MMKIVIAPDSFKGTLSANEVAVIIKDSLHKVFRENNEDVNIDLAPIADGGEGTSTVLLEHLGGVKIVKTVTGPEFQPVDAFYVILHDSIAVIEVAESSGLKHCHNLDTKTTTTFGLGELIKDALSHNVSEIIICLGGSGTTDGGVGMASALGATFSMKDSKTVIPTGQTLHMIQDISLQSLDPRVAQTSFKILVDVNNPLYGTNGAAFVYGPQKGATPSDVELLDKGLQHYASVLQRIFHKDYASFEGAGAAGGLGSGCFAFLNAQIVPGIETLLQLIHFDQTISDADVVITGEGKLDEQSFMGKAITGIIKHAEGKELIIICGDNSCTDDCKDLQDITIFAATDYSSKEESLENPRKSLEIASNECGLYLLQTIEKK